jgi:hypothetical protein
MKTLKQIREEYDAKFLDRFDSAPDELMLEGRDSSKSTRVPSAKQMPVMLVFRRLQYRIFPDRQVVALYYSSMVNKYLSIPFGPEGNLNLSESVILDEEQLDEFLQFAPAIAGALEAGGAAVTGAAARGLAMAGARTAARQVGKLGIRKVAGGYLKRGVKALGKQVAKNALKSAISGDEKEKQPSASDQIKSSVMKSEIRPQSDVVRKSSWDIGSNKALETRKSQIRSADIAQARNTLSGGLRENKMSDLRDMINEGTELKTLEINGRQVNINMGMAKRILEVYDSVNTKNKKIVEGMLNEDLESFKKLLNFSIRK